MIFQGTQLIELSGEAESEIMGRSYLRRRAAAVSRVARKTTRAAAPLIQKISHSALNVAAKVPGYGLAVTAARSGFAANARAAMQAPGGPAYNTPGGGVSVPSAPGAPSAPDSAESAAPGAGMSTGKKIAIGAGVAAALGVAFVVFKKAGK